MGTRTLWLKDDGAIHEAYGGNKPRKLVHLLEDAARKRKHHLLTVGAAGSHHVLATAILGKLAGFSSTALLLPRPYSCHAEQTTLQAKAADAELISLISLSDAPRIIRMVLRRDSYFIPPGGSNALGALGYLEALLELEQQIHAGDLPEPELIFVALGSGGTAAGILAGLATSSLRSRLVAIPVLSLPTPRRIVLALAERTLRLTGRTPNRPLDSLLEIDARWIGPGYGQITQAGETAIAFAAQYGLLLESTYTGKAFAACQGWLRGPIDRGNVSARAAEMLVPRLEEDVANHPKHALFWCTISSRLLSPFKPGKATLPQSIARLLRVPS